MGYTIIGRLGVTMCYKIFVKYNYPDLMACWMEPGWRTYSSTFKPWRI